MGMIIFIAVMVAVWYFSFTAGAKQAMESYEEFLKERNLKTDYVNWIGRKIDGT